MVTLTIQKDRLLGNLKKIQTQLGQTAIIPEVDCDGYGMGGTALSSLYHAAGARMVAVSDLEQAERIRAALPGLPVLLTAPYTSGAFARRIFDAGIIPTLGCAEDIRLLSEVAERENLPIPCHVRLDIGSGLAGFSAERPEALLEALEQHRYVKVSGVFSSFSDGESPADVKREYKSFLAACEALSESDIPLGLLHLCDDKSAFKFPEYHLDAVRIGAAIGGRLPGKDRWNLELQKAGRLVAEVCSIREADGRTLALVPLGLADGIFAGDGLEPALKSGADTFCLMYGEELSIYGVPSLGLCAVDVTGYECEVGDAASFAVNPLMVKAEVAREYT